MTSHTNGDKPLSLQLEEKANIIGQKLKKLQEKYADATEKKSISMMEIVYIIEFMAEQLNTDHGHLFEDHFIGHLDIFTELSNENPTDEFKASFEKITNMLCDAITNKRLPAKSLHHLLTKWLHCLEQIPCKSKYDVYQSLTLKSASKTGHEFNSTLYGDEGTIIHFKPIQNTTLYGDDGTLVHFNPKVPNHSTFYDEETWKRPATVCVDDDDAPNSAKVLTSGNGSLSDDQQIDDGKIPAIDVIDMICACRDENLKMALVRIRDAADRTIRFMDTCCCSDINTSE